MELNQQPLVLFLAVLSCFLRIPAEALGQRISFGVVSGATLLDDNEPPFADHFGIRRSEGKCESSSSMDTEPGGRPFTAS